MFPLASTSPSWRPRPGVCGRLCQAALGRCFQRQLPVSRRRRPQALAGRSGETHTCLPDAGAAKPGGCAGGVGGGRGGGRLGMGEQLPLHSRSGPARSVQTLVKSCREPRGDGAGARTWRGASKAGLEPEVWWGGFAGERSHVIVFSCLND